MVSASTLGPAWLPWIVVVFVGGLALAAVVRRARRSRLRAETWLEREGLGTPPQPPEQASPPRIEPKVRQRLREVQRLETIGQLSGRLVHDVNNYLTIILNYAQVLALSSEQSSERDGPIAGIVAAAERAAVLTRRLLTLSRSPSGSGEPVDLSDLVSNLEPMLGGLLGESCSLELRLSPDLPRVHADASELELVLLNLALNSRDAMPAGGRLRVETAVVTSPPGELPPGAPVGPWVRMALSDDGHGMEPDVCAHIFEPFFTTKGQDRGTGIGLFTVHAIVEQARGLIRVESEPGRGTIFEIYLPAAPREVAHEPSSAELVSACL